MNIEQNIKDVITKKLEEGFLEKAIEEQLERSIQNALNELFGSYGDVTKIIKDKVKSVMIPYVEQYDYSEFITKIDGTLVEILKFSTIENAKILENFKDLITLNPGKEINLTDVFTHWTNYVQKEISTEELEVNTDDGPTYETVNVTMEVNHSESRSWSSQKNAVIFFECEKDKEMNKEIKIRRWKDDYEGEWRLEYDFIHDLNSLRYLNTFEVFLMNLKQNGTAIILDTEYEEDDITPDAEPEAVFY